MYSTFEHSFNVHTCTYIHVKVSIHEDKSLQLYLVVAGASPIVWTGHFCFKIWSQGPNFGPSATSPTNSNQFEFLGQVPATNVSQNASQELFVAQVPVTSPFA